MYEGKLLNTRQQIDYVDKCARTNVRANLCTMFMRIVCVNLWNALACNLKNGKTRSIFKQSYKDNGQRTYYYNDQNNV